MKSFAFRLNESEIGVLDAGTGGGLNAVGYVGVGLKLVAF